MSKLNFIISKANFELVRDRIGEILTAELDNQALLQGTISEEDPPEPTIPNPDLIAEIYTERFIPVDKSEGNVIIVAIDRLSLDQQTPISQRNTVNYLIDIYTNAYESEDSEGYYYASTKLHRLAGLVRSILQSPYYDRLGFANGMVERRSVSEINFDNGNNNQDATFSRMCRVTLSVVVHEEQTGISVTPGSSYTTQVKLSTTNKGYKFIKNSTL